MTTNDNSKLLRQLLDIGRQMAETRALEPLLTYAVDVTLELLNAQFGFLVLANDDGTLDFRVARDKQGNDIPNPETQISRTILYRVIEEKKFRRTASAIEDASFSDASSVAELDLKSVLCVPLISQGNAIGVIYLENRQKYDLFTDGDAEPLQYLAGHTAVCIQNAILNEQLELQAHQRMDELTRLSMDGEIPADVVKNMAEKERSRILYNFIQDASHQFRTPLAVIKTSVDLLKRKIDTEQYGNYLERIRYQVDSIVTLVDSLNLLAKLDSDLDKRFLSENLALIVHDMWEVMLQRARNKNIDLQEFSAEQNIQVELIPDYARQAIGKILENAINFTEANGNIRIDIVETDEAGHVIITDTGVGITLEDFPHVMTRFYRGDKAGTTRGLGLGLSIVERIMMVHNGYIHMDSELGQGTRVELIFPKVRGQ